MSGSFAKLGCWTDGNILWKIEKKRSNEKTLIPMSAWAQDGSKRQALAARLAQKGALKSVRARQFREKAALDR